MINPGYRTYRPTTIQIVIKKSDKEKFKDIEKFVDKIGLCLLPDFPKEYPSIPGQWLTHDEEMERNICLKVIYLYGESPR